MTPSQPAAVVEPTPPKDRNKPTNTSSDRRKSQCSLCSKIHFIFHCSHFKKMDAQQRRHHIQAVSLCINCLRPGHSVQDCRSSSCMICRLQHHTLIHIDANNSTGMVNSVFQSSPVVPTKHPKTENPVKNSQFLISGSFGQQLVVRTRVHNRAEFSISVNRVKNDMPLKRMDDWIHFYHSEILKNPTANTTAQFTVFSCQPNYRFQTVAVNVVPKATKEVDSIFSFEFKNRVRLLDRVKDPSVTSSALRTELGWGMTNNHVTKHLLQSFIDTKKITSTEPADGSENKVSERFLFVEELPEKPTTQTSQQTPVQQHRSTLPVFSPNAGRPVVILFKRRPTLQAGENRRTAQGSYHKPEKKPVKSSDAATQVCCSSLRAVAKTKSHLSNSQTFVASRGDTTTKTVQQQCATLPVISPTVGRLVKILNKRKSTLQSGENRRTALGSYHRTDKKTFKISEAANQVCCSSIRAVATTRSHPSNSRTFVAIRMTSAAKTHQISVWLQQKPNFNSPQPTADLVQHQPEAANIVAVFATTTPSVRWWEHILQCHIFLLHAVSCMFRFCRMVKAVCQRQPAEKKPLLSAAESTAAKPTSFKTLQANTVGAEPGRLSAANPASVTKKPNLRPHPVRSRTTKSTLTPLQKPLITLSSAEVVTKLLFKCVYFSSLQYEPTHLLAMVAQLLYVLGTNRLCKTNSQSCYAPIRTEHCHPLPKTKDDVPPSTAGSTLYSFMKQMLHGGEYVQASSALPAATARAVA